MDRRQFLQSTALGLAAAGTGLQPMRAMAQGEPIRIGLMAPLTGVIASGGKEMVEGTQFWFEKINYQIAGRKVELIIEDDASNPDTALQKARRLVEQNNVHFLTGNLLANTGLAVANYVKGTGTPYFIPIIAADELTQRGRIPNVIRTAGYSGSAFPRPLADWALKQGYKRIATISQDYTFGHEQCGGFSQVFTEGGGTIVQQFWHPLNTADFSPYLGQIADLKIDAIFVMETGADATRFTQQFNSFGLKGKIPLLGAMNMTDQSVIRTMGAEVEGIISAAHFAEGADIAATKDFVDAYTKKYEKIPSLYGFSMYSGMMWVSRAIEKLGGKVEDKAALLDAVLKTELADSPLGKPVKLDAYGNPIYDVYIRKVTKRADGKFWNVPVETYPAVSQFWKYDPETFMKEPAFSRTYQGVKKS
ncbi:MAG: twin-arginine translocation signal domain-containing protein [Rhizobiales bacterium]|jgi:branched-chain amino acid transport system substrate-binding protein|nr:twin-arginine translocation signal domain-containing protein [Hyphomicrobiales bacterium]